MANFFSCLTVCALLFGVTTANATLIRLQLAPVGATQMTSGYDPTAASADSVFGSSGENIWDLRANSSSAIVEYSGLKDTSTGLPSGISLTLRAGNGVESAQATTAGGKSISGAQYMFAGESFIISGLTAGEPLHLLGYGLNNRNWGVSFASGSSGITEPAVSNFLLGQHTNNLTLNALTITPTGTSLSGTWWQGNEEAGSRVHVMALQIYQSVPVPEPSTLLLIGMGGLSLISFGRRFRQEAEKK